MVRPLAKTVAGMAPQTPPPPPPPLTLAFRRKFLTFKGLYLIYTILLYSLPPTGRKLYMTNIHGRVLTWTRFLIIVFTQEYPPEHEEYNTDARGGEGRGGSIGLRESDIFETIVVLAIIWTILLNWLTISGSSLFILSPTLTSSWFKGNAYTFKRSDGFVPFWKGIYAKRGCSP